MRLCPCLLQSLSNMNLYAFNVTDVTTPKTHLGRIQASVSCQLEMAFPSLIDITV